MAYQKQTWRDYDDNKTELQNLNNGALVTPERMNHIETGIANSVDQSTFEQNKVSVEQQLAETEQSLNAQLAQTESKKVDKDGSGQVAYANLAQDVREKFTGGNTAIVGDDSIITTNLTNKVVTYEKTNFEKEVALRIKNQITNGNFAIDSNADGFADGWKGNGANVTFPKVENNTQYWTPLTNAFSGSIQSTVVANVFGGHKYYITYEKVNVSNAYFPSTSFNIGGSSQDGRVALIYTPSANANGTITFYGNVTNIESSVKNVMIVDLTEAFGSGNEPDKDYFEYMLNILGYDWFDETLNLTDVSKNGIITAKELKLYDPYETLSTKNVNDTLIDLKNTINEISSTEGILQIKNGKNLYNPKNNMSGRIGNVTIGEVITFVDTDIITPFVYQRVKIDNTNDVSIRGIANYVITDENNVALTTKRYPNKYEVTTISSSSIPENACLWVATEIGDEKTRAQIGIGSSLSAYEPYREIEGIYTNDKKFLSYPLDTAYQSEHQASLLRLESERLKEEIQILKSNTQAIFNVKMDKVADREEIILKNTDKKKLILHLHKRENDGYDTTNDVYLPNAEDDFSDIKITNTEGAVLPYRLVHYANDLDIVTDSRLADKQKISLMLVDSTGKLITTQEYISESTDDGATWTVIPAFSSFKDARINLISKNGTLFFNHDGYLYRSEPPFTSYTQVFDLDPLKQYTTVHITSKSMVQHPDGEIFFGAYQTERNIKVYKSVDDGLNWTLSADWGDKYQHVHGMYIDKYATPMAIYAGLDGGGGVIKTTDKGGTWIDLREQNPDMPQSTDYGVRYADPSGYRLLGGETPIMGGYSITKTANDVDFRPVLNSGISVNYVEKMDGRLFATASGDKAFRVGGVYMSEDEGETWKSIYTTSYLAGNGVNDGYRHMLNLGNQIIVGPESSASTPVQPLRILQDGNYAEIIVDVPEGSESIIVETGHIYTNIQPLSNDTDVSGEYLVRFDLNEGGGIIKESVSKRYYQGNFEWTKAGKHLPFFYPYITLPSESRSVLAKSLEGYEVDSTNFVTTQGITISLWGKIGYNTSIALFRTDLGDVLEILTGDRLRLNQTTKTTFRHPIVPEAFNKIDVTIDANGVSKTYDNGKMIYTSPNDLTDILTAIENSTKMTMLTTWNYDDMSCIQHFSVRKGVVSDEQLHAEYHSYVNDNML